MYFVLDQTTMKTKRPATNNSRQQLAPLSFSFFYFTLFLRSSSLFFALPFCFPDLFSVYKEKMFLSIFCVFFVCSVSICFSVWNPPL